MAPGHLWPAYPGTLLGGARTPSNLSYYTELDCVPPNSLSFPEPQDTTLLGSRVLANVASQGEVTLGWLGGTRGSIRLVSLEEQRP